MNRKISNEDREEIVRLAKQGEFHSTIARKFNVTADYVSKLHRRA